jgi:hypothetical protein
MFHYMVVLTFSRPETHSTITDIDTVSCDVSLDMNEVYEHFLDKYRLPSNGFKLIDIDCPKLMPKK